MKGETWRDDREKRSGTVKCRGVGRDTEEARQSRLG